MAKIKMNLGGQKVKVDAARAKQMQEEALAQASGAAQQTGMVDPLEIGTRMGGISDDTLGRVKGAVDQHLGTGTLDRAKEAIKTGVGKLGLTGRSLMGQTPINPKQQKTMFDTVQATTKLNPQTDITKINQNRWKDIQRKFGLTEV